MIKKALLGVFSICILSSCATTDFSTYLGDPQNLADSLAGQNGFEKQLIPTQYFHLASYTKIQNPGAPINIYIEGDGFAWRTKTQISENPTPHHPLALQLASVDPSENVAYLARPCQYIDLNDQANCDSAYWSSKRFSEEVIVSMNEAIGFLSTKSSSKKINLIGYSGGGAVAMLVAARRTDVETIRTIAGNLDHEALNRYHKVSFIKHSLNPINVASKLSQLPQRHFVGNQDKIIPLFIAQQFKQASFDSSCVQITSVPNATHQRGWKERWQELLKMPVTCE